ncbi:MAG: hypothetical protein HC794_03995 [Nitrospiraceae bacterium]|nr:hypothetical protein [Nitrospiraceae bacterium]
MRVQPRDAFAGQLPVVAEVVDGAAFQVAAPQAQLSLLYDESTEERLAAVRASVVVAGGSSRSVARTDPKHPFHWAPFILIGNGL